MKDEGIREFCEGLKSNATLTQLNLRRDNKRNYKIEKIIMKCIDREWVWLSWGTKHTRCADDKHFLTFIRFESLVLQNEVDDLTSKLFYNE